MKAAFLDRDGVINRNAPRGRYIKSWDELEVLPGVADAIRLLNGANFRVIVVTNQRGVSLGLMTVEDLEEIHRRLLERLNSAGARIDAVYYCPHGEGQCDCRKPATGMFRRALDEFPEISLRDSIVIGDSWRDMEAAGVLGCSRILVQDATEPSCAGEPRMDVDGVAASLLEAVRQFAVGEA